MRFMGNGYRYSFDLSILLLGTSINLAGFPYSAGFLGKELLVFHTLRDDFTSYWVRGCWLISFFFTPIYMLSLLFFVYFGQAKAAPSLYTVSWTLNFRTKITNNYFHSTNFKSLTHNMLSRFQWTLVTARPTIYVLTTMWLFFYTFGDFFLSLMFNYNTLVDTIPSSCFTFIKTHTIFMTESSNVFLSNTLFIFIVFLFMSACLFLINLRLTFNYNYFRLNYYQELAFLLLVMYLFLL